MRHDSAGFSHAAIKERPHEPAREAVGEVAGRDGWKNRADCMNVGMDSRGWSIVLDMETWRIE